MKTTAKRALQLLLLTATCLSATVQAAATDIANSPMASSSTTSVKPNIMFILDDSGSMDWEYLPDSVNNNNSKFCYRNNNYNGVYYNPNITYDLPVNADGTSYSNSVFTAALVSGFSGTTTKNLSTGFRTGNDGSDRAAYYYKYTGASPATPVRGTCYADGSYTLVTVSSTSGPGNTDERQNFANWYTYYRDRMHTMKSAAGRAFKDIGNNFRVGFSTIGYTGVDSTDNRFLKIADFDSTQKASWYSKLYITGTPGYTPLRPALAKAGRIYAGQLLTGANDPVQYSCQQNFTILSTDGYWNTNDESSSYGPDRIDGSTNVGQQDGTAARPMNDGSTVSRSTSQIQQSQTQVSQSTSQLQKRTQLAQSTSTLQGTLSKVLMQCNNTSAACGTAPATGIANANWSVVASGSCIINTNVQCEVVSGLSGTVNVATTCNTGAIIASSGGAGTATLTITNVSGGSGASIDSVTFGGTQIFSQETNDHTNQNTVASRVAAEINACTSSLAGACTATGNSATVNNNVVTISGPNITAAPVVHVSRGTATVTVSFTGGGAVTPPSNTISAYMNENSHKMALDLNNGSPDTSRCVSLGGSGSGEAWFCRGSGSSNPSGASSSTVTDSTGTTWYLVNNTSGNTGCTTNNAAFGSGYSTTWGACPGIASGGGGSGTGYTLNNADSNGNVYSSCAYSAWIPSAGACTPVSQSATPNNTSVVTAMQCVSDSGWVGASSCTAGSSDSGTITCQTVTTGPTDVSSCTAVSAASGNNWTQTTCTTTVISPATGVASCTPVAASAGNSYVATSCNTVTTGPTTVPSCTAAAAAAGNSWTATTCTAGSGGVSDSLADVAMYYYQADLRTSALGNCTGALGADVCDNNVPGSGVDVNAQQHMTTFTLGLGVDGTLGYADNYQSGGSADYNAIVQGTMNWPDPISNSGAERIDDLWHAAVNGRGVYYSARDPDTLVTGISNALAGVTARAGSAAAAATSNLEPVAGDNYLFVALYRTVFWDGDLQAKTIDPVTGAVSSTPIWTAQPLLDLKVGASSDTRTIYTFDSGTANKLKSFLWAGLSVTEQGYFNSVCTGAGQLSQCASLTAAEQTSAVGENLVNYLRGQNGNEATLYRDRDHVLGDMVTSQPVYVKKPPFEYVDASYATFRDATQASRTPMVYVAANDGMLHAFNGDTGQEEWTYIPPMVLSNLYRLADKTYSANHRYYVDGSPTVADICPNAPASTCTAAQWKTILVGGLNAGGRGYYALDITNPATPKALWNFTTTEDSDLGYSFGNPVVAKRKDGTWVVAVTSGYNNVSPGNGQGYLYALNANTGAVLEKISTSAGDTTTPSGLAKINVWVNEPTDNTAERFYGGDLLGNLWRFSLDGGTPPAAPVSTAGATVQLAQLGATQPITTKPELTIVPYGGVDYMVVQFGTGRYLGLTDLSNTDQQSVYAIKDNLSGTGLGTVRTNGVLVSQTLSNFTGASGEQLRTTSTNPVDWVNKSGWYVDLNPANSSPGERVNVDVQLQLGSLTVATNVPSTNACNVGGYSFLYNFDFKSGQYLQTATVQAVGSRLSSGAMVAGMNTIRLQSGKVITIITDTGGGITSQETPTAVASSGTANRVSWRELIQ